VRSGGAVRRGRLSALCVRGAPIDLRSGAIASVSGCRRGLSHNGVFRQPGDKAFIPPIVLALSRPAQDSLALRPADYVIYLEMVPTLKKPSLTSQGAPPGSGAHIDRRVDDSRGTSGSPRLDVISLRFRSRRSTARAVT
jgi:hypothetical protein